MSPHGTYHVVVDGEKKGPFGIVGQTMNISHVRTIRGNAVPKDAVPHVDGEPVGEQVPVGNGATIEFH